ncbi:MAG TPA: putative cytokinetic ring protein SteA [Acidimicrobiales bacterium]|nr:putative cytokinetic ring protein SteA [Acidimicrobiales bacterium]
MAIEVPKTVVRGRARIGRRTKELVGELQPGEVAVIDHADLDRVAAEGLVAARPAAVINAAASISGRYPNVGPLLLAAAGIPLVDNVGSDVIDALTDGVEITIEGSILSAGGWSAAGVRQDMASLERSIESCRETLGDELDRFATNTLEHLRGEHRALLEPMAIPELGVDLAGRHALVVVRGHDYREDLGALRRGGYIAEVRPVLIGVDGGADALLELGRTPDIIVGDMDSVSERALRSGARLVVHAYPSGEAPGSARLDALDLDYALFAAPGTSEDIAMLLAYEGRAEIIVAVGTHSSMADFLDKGRSGMASTFLVRMKVGARLVDAKGVSRLYHSRVRKGDLFLLVVAALFALLVVTAISQPARLFLENLWNTLRLG